MMRAHVEVLYRGECSQEKPARFKLEGCKIGKGNKLSENIVNILYFQWDSITLKGVKTGCWGVIERQYERPLYIHG